MQKIICAEDDLKELDKYIMESHAKKLLLVCGSSIRFLKYDEYFNEMQERMGAEVVRFSGYTSNPQYEDVVKGVDEFKSEHCDMIVAVGGGSAMDVAKCIKLFSNMEMSSGGMTYLEQLIAPNDVKLVAIPTTAGTGSEATHFAVIYYKGEKISVDDESCIPAAVVMDSSVLGALPVYQKKVTLLDALCHGVESYWSVNSTKESKAYSKEAIKLILDNIDRYLDLDGSGFDGEKMKVSNHNNTDIGCKSDVNRNMLHASYLAGKAINITKTTVGHAMCYKLTTLYGIAHGHAAALCVSKLFPYMIGNTDDCIDPRGKQYLDEMFSELSKILGCDNLGQAGVFFDKLIEKLGLNIPVPSDKDYDILRESVNVERLKNNPIKLNDVGIDKLYHEILQETAKK